MVRARLQALFAANDPAQSANVDQYLDGYNGRDPRELFDALEKQYPRR